MAGEGEEQRGIYGNLLRMVFRKTWNLFSLYKIKTSKGDKIGGQVSLCLQSNKSKSIRQMKLHESTTSEKEMKNSRIYSWSITSLFLYTLWDCGCASPFWIFREYTSKHCYWYYNISNYIIHKCIPQMHDEHLLYTRHFVKPWWYCSKYWLYDIYLRKFTVCSRKYLLASKIILFIFLADWISFLFRY